VATGVVVVILASLPTISTSTSRKSRSHNSSSHLQANQPTHMPTIMGGPVGQSAAAPATTPSREPAKGPMPRQARLGVGTEIATSNNKHHHTSTMNLQLPNTTPGPMTEGLVVLQPPLVVKRTTLDVATTSMNALERAVLDLYEGQGMELAHPPPRVLTDLVQKAQPTRVAPLVREILGQTGRDAVTVKMDTQLLLDSRPPPPLWSHT
jgi:hypothetical protein